MKLKYVTKTPKNIKIYSTKRVNNIFEGKYKSIIKGKNTFFDSLRNYEIYDDIKHIDWKSSAKHNKLLIKQYQNENNHNINIILDSSYTMNAHTNHNELKKIISIYTCANIGTVTLSNNDKLNILINNKIYNINNIYQLDNILQKYELIDDKHNTINESLKQLQVNKKSIIFLITDIKGLNSIHLSMIKKLSINNNILIININDHNLCQNNLYNIDTNKYIPSFFTKDKKLLTKEIEVKNNLLNNMKEIFNKYRIPSICISSQKEIIIKLIKLLEEYKHANK